MYYNSNIILPYYVINFDSSCADIWVKKEIKAISQDSHVRNMSLFLLTVNILLRIICDDENKWR